jgi:ADP-ribose pyrophosphatase YjhB (NUDIX family)
MTESEIACVQARYGKGPSVAADMAVVTGHWNNCVEGETSCKLELRLLLIERKNKPYQGCWALPGGFVELDEDLECAARRELKEETGIETLGSSCVEQVGAFGNPSRDPRGRVVGVTFLTWIRESELPEVCGDDDASNAEFFRFCNGVAIDGCGNAVPLAFDHDEVLLAIWERMVRQAQCSSIPLTLLPDCFGREQIVGLYEALCGLSDPDVLIGFLEFSGWIRREGSMWTRELGHSGAVRFPWIR